MRVEPLEAGRWSQCTVSPSTVRWGTFAKCTWQRGESESMDVWARRVFCRGESADRGHVHLCTKGHSDCHVGDHDLHCLEWRVVPRGEKHPTWVGFDEEGPTPSVRGGDTRDEDVPNELTALDGHEGPPLFPPINPLAVAAGELEESLLGPLPGGIDTRPRTEGAEARTVSLIRPGLPVRNEEATPRIGKRCTRSPSRRRSSSQRHDQRKSDFRLRRRLASVVKEYSRHPRGTGVRPVSKAQDAYDSCGEDHAAGNAPGGSQVQAKPKAQQEINEENENGIIISELDRKWCDFGHGVRGSGSRVKQRRNVRIQSNTPGGLLRSFLRTIGSQVVTTGDTQGALGEVRLLESVPDLATKYLDKITTRRSFAVSTSAEMRVLAEVTGLVDGLPCGARGRHHGPEVPSPRVRCHRRGIVEQSKAFGTGPLWTELRLSPQDCKEI